MVLKGIYSTFVQQLANLLSKMGFGSLDAFATAQNAGAPYSFLLAPNFALINYLYNNSQASLLLWPSHVFAPQTLSGMAVVGAGVALTYTDLAQIPTAIINAAINGMLAVTLTASGEDAVGNAVTGRTWTATPDNGTAGQASTFIPSHGGDRIAYITAMTRTGTATASSFNLQSVLERVAV